VLVGDTLDRTNWGCRATSGALREMISERADLDDVIDYRVLRWRVSPGFRALDQARPADAALRVRAPDTRVGDPPGVRGLLARGRRYAQWKASELELPPRGLVPTRVAALDATWRRWVRDPVVADWVAALQACDVVIVNGEGALRPNAGSGRFCLFLAWAAKARLGKTVAVVNHLCDLADPELRDFAEVVYPLVDDVVVRGSASLDVARAVAPTARLTTAPDAAFRQRPSPREAYRAVASRPGYFTIYPSAPVPFDPGEPYVCVGGSARFQDGERIGAGTEAWYAELVHRLRARHQVVLLGHDYPDHVVFERLGRALAVPFVGVQCPIPQVVDLLAHGTVYLGGRWHSAVLAAIGGTPVLPLASNSDVKTRDLADFVAPPDGWSPRGPHEPADLAAVVSYMVDDEPALRRAASARTRGFAVGARRHVEVLERPATAAAGVTRRLGQTA
jgi:hypothetical protein